MIFVDTSFWIALHQRKDTNHELAIGVARGLKGALLLTSNLVLGETWTLLRRREGHRRAMTWVNLLRSSPGVRLEGILPDLEEQAWAWLAVRDERAYSFVDATSFALMRGLGIREALAFGGDFTAAGFVELRP